MSFSIHKNDRAGSPVNEVMPAAAGTYAIGQALAFNGGVLKAASGTTKPTHIAAESKTLGSAGTLYVHKIEPTIVYKSEMSVAGAKTVGASYTLSTDGMGITNTTTDGVATVVEADGATVNDAVYIRFA